MFLFKILIKILKLVIVIYLFYLTKIYYLLLNIYIKNQIKQFYSYILYLLHKKIY